MKIRTIFNVIILFSTLSCFADSICLSPSEAMISQAERTLKISQVKSSERVYFYTQPDNKYKGKNFVINNNRLISFKKYKNFDYVAYINKAGHTVNGWVKNANLTEVKYPENIISPRDYEITMGNIKISIGQLVGELKNEVLAKTGKEITLSMVGDNEGATVFGIDFPFNKDASVYVSDLNHSERNNSEESVTQISIYSNEYKTNRGIKIGDDFRLVSKIYGDDGIVDIQQGGGETLSFQYLDMVLIFSFNASNKVGSIVYVLLPWSSVVEVLQCSNNISLLHRISKISQCN